MQEFYAYQSPDLKKIVFKNTSAIIAGRVINLFFTIVSSVLIARYLGSEKLGQYASLYAYLTLFSWLTTLGMEQIIVRESAKQKEQAEKFFGTATVISSLLSIFATALAIFSSIILGYANTLQILLFVAAIDILLLSPLRLYGLVFLI